ELARARIEPALQGADDARRDPRRVPVHAHHRAEGLEPEGMGETAQEFVAAIMMHDRFGDDRPEPRHALAEPSGHTAVVQRQIGASAASGHGASSWRDGQSGKPCRELNVNLALSPTSRKLRPVCEDRCAYNCVSLRNASGETI